MALKDNSNTATGRRRSLVKDLVTELRDSILNGEIPVGQKLPSEAALTEKRAVSRTVVREAVAALRSEGFVEPRQGAGVFVIGIQSKFPVNFEGLETEKLSSLVEMMEFRIAVEAESAALAAERRSPAQEEKILEALEAIDDAVSDGKPTGPLDLEFHLAIAEATNNPRFVEFLTLLGKRAIPRARISERDEMEPDSAYLEQLSTEHRRIYEAISDRDSQEARLAMHNHLEWGMKRYQNLRRKHPQLV